MIMEFEFEGVRYEAEVYDFELSSICVKGTNELLAYSHDLFLEAETLILNDIVGMAEAAYDQSQDR